MAARLDKIDNAASRLTQMRPDLLSELLSPLRLRGEEISELAVEAGSWFEIDAHGPTFHLVEGHPARLRHAAGEMDASPGDLVMFPNGGAHAFKAAGAGSTQLISGRFTFDGASGTSILESLPQVLKVSRGQGNNSEWLEPLAHFLLAESRSSAPGAKIMISRLIDVLVVRTMRSWSSAPDGEGRGWLGGLADLRIERALSALHADPLRHWTVAALAEISAMSRSAFTARFAACTGEPPLRYISNWKLALARDLLASGTRRVTEVAREVGYESDGAFSRAFSKRFGHPPTGTRSPPN